MARQVVEKKDFTFVGGLNTEAGYLTFPANAWLDGDNVEPNIDGSISRRAKLDFEASHQVISSFSTTSKENNAYTCFLWQNAGGHGTITFAVVQVGATIYFFSTEASSLTPNVKAFTIDLNSYKVPTSPNIFATDPIDVTVGNGKLVIVSEDTEPILVEYDLDADDITVSTITLQIRDLLGVNDNHIVNVYASSLEYPHHYNLLNQGWDDTKINTYFSTVGYYPTNAQIWTAGKDASDNFDPATLNKQDFGTTQSPRGRFILDLFTRDRSTASGVAGLNVETEDHRPTTVAFYAGRAWYAGVKSPEIGSWVTFSQIVEDNTKYGKCYQEGDPTSEFNSDLVSTDGGIIPIPEAGGIKKLIPLQQSLIVLAENGVWQISGGTSGFTATGYQVNKITAFGCSSQYSVINVDSTIMYWSPAGIFSLKYDSVNASFSAEAVSLGKIQTMYSHIPNFGKKYSSGFYNDETKKVFWLYQEEETDSSVDRYAKTRILLLDLRLGAFYTYTIASGEGYPVLISGIMTTNQGAQDLTLSVLSDTDSVLSSADDVASTITLTAHHPRTNKFLTITPITASTWGITFSDFLATQDSPDKFMDWFSFDSVGIETEELPYLISGYQILEDGAKIFQAPYIQTYMKRTETGFTDVGGGQLDADNVSSCLLQAHWQWTDSQAANRWTTSQEVYRHRRLYTPEDASDTYDDGFPLVVAKTKIRGKGEALSLKFSASSGKDLQLVGWSIIYTKNTNV